MEHHIVLLKSHNQAPPISSVMSGYWADAAQCILGVAGLLPFKAKGNTTALFPLFSHQRSAAD